MAVAPVGQVRVGGEDRLVIRIALGVGVVAESVDALVAGGAAVVAGDFLEVVVDRQLGEADLLDLGRRASGRSRAARGGTP